MPKSSTALLLPLLHPLVGRQLSALPQPLLTDPSLQFLLPVDVHVHVVVYVGSDTRVDQRRNEKSHRGRSVIVYFQIESFRPSCDDNAEVKLGRKVLTRNTVEKADRKRQYI